MTNLTPATALIIGGTSGIGLETAKQLVAQGNDIIIVGNKVDKLNAAVAQLSLLGSVSGFQADFKRISSEFIRHARPCAIDQDDPLNR
jgi:short-subunit dehydrogenase involved in D-alanine esterification of teichoic acids